MDVPLKELVQTSRKDRFCSKIIEYGILAVIIFSPLPAASVYDWSILVIQIALIIMTLAYLVMNTDSGAPSLLAQSLNWPRRLSWGLVFFLALQIVPLPALLVKGLSPSTFSRKSSYGGLSSWMSLSMIPDRTLRDGTMLLGCFLLGFLILKTVKHRSQIYRMLYVLIGMGIFESLFGFLQLYSSNPRILFYKKIYNLDSVAGTFVNRNHFSAYLEMIIPLAIGLIIARMGLFSSSELKPRDFVGRFSEKTFTANLFLFLGLVVMGLAVVFSKSRSGVFIFALILLSFAGAGVLFRDRAAYYKKAVMVTLQVLFLIILGISLYVGVNATLARFGMDKMLQEQRPAFWAATLRLFSDFPIAGTGLGTFSSLYPGSEENGQLFHIYHAHNDYLEYLSELGILGMGLLVGAVLSLLVITFRTWRTRRHSEIRGLAFGGFISVLAILFHSVTDFNMHIPANMLLFSIVLALTAAISFYKKANTVGFEQKRPLQNKELKSI